MKIRIPQLLLIAGTGRNSGKTTLACAIIQNICHNQPVMAIKITPHFHENSTSGKIIMNRNDLVIIQETQYETNKDSSRMLRAGAERVYFVMAKDDQLTEAIQLILDIHTNNIPIICESGGLFRLVEPGLCLIMNRTDQTDFKPYTDLMKELADRWITFDGNNTDFDPETITYSAKKWKIAAKN